MNKPDTILEWLNTLEWPHVRDRALRQYDGKVQRADTLLDAIVWFRKWDETDEGADFWEMVFESVQNNTPLPSFLPLRGEPCEEPLTFEKMQARFVTLTPEGTWEPMSDDEHPVDAIDEVDDDLPPALPTDSAERKMSPVYSGFVKYFPRSMARVARLSYEGNQQHHPDKPLHWDMDKSTDELDCLMRHTLDGITATTYDQIIEEAARVAWRGMADLERKLTGKCQYMRQRGFYDSQTENKTENKDI